MQGSNICLSSGNVAPMEDYGIRAVARGCVVGGPCWYGPGSDIQSSLSWSGSQHLQSLAVGRNCFFSFLARLAGCVLQV